MFNLVQEVILGESGILTNGLIYDKRHRCLTTQKLRQKVHIEREKTKRI